MEISINMEDGAEVMFIQTVAQDTRERVVMGCGQKDIATMDRM